MPSVMTLDGPSLGLGSAYGDFVLRQGPVVGGLLALGTSLVVSAAVSAAAVYGLRKVGAIKPEGLRGAGRRRRRRGRR